MKRFIFIFCLTPIIVLAGTRPKLGLDRLKEIKQAKVKNVLCVQDLLGSTQGYTDSVKENVKVFSNDHLIKVAETSSAYELRSLLLECNEFQEYGHLDFQENPEKKSLNMRVI